MPENPPGTYTPGPGVSNCDYDHNGKINFTDSGNHPSEDDCNTACMGSGSAAPLDPECSEYSAFTAQSSFELVVQDATSQNGGCTGLVQARVQVNASAANSFNPVANQGATSGLSAASSRTSRGARSSP